MIRRPFRRACLEHVHGSWCVKVSSGVNRIKAVEMRGSARFRSNICTRKPTHATTRCSQPSRLTGCPVIVNTSFNVRGEPIVCTPEDAFHCFMGTGIEALAIGKCFLRKEDQDPALEQNYETAFELD